MLFQVIAVQVAATKCTTLYRMLEGSTLESALTESRRESDDDFTRHGLVSRGAPARLIPGSITTSAKWADLKLPYGPVRVPFEQLARRGDPNSGR